MCGILIYQLGHRCLWYAGAAMTLHNNTKAFGLMPQATQVAMRKLRDQGGIFLEYDSDGEWTNVLPRKFWLNKVYRLKEEKKE